MPPKLRGMSQMERDMEVRVMRKEMEVKGKGNKSVEMRIKGLELELLRQREVTRQKYLELEAKKLEFRLLEEQFRSVKGEDMVEGDVFGGKTGSGDEESPQLEKEPNHIIQLQSAFGIEVNAELLGSVGQDSIDPRIGVRVVSAEGLNSNLLLTPDSGACLARQAGRYGGGVKPIRGTFESETNIGESELPEVQGEASRGEAGEETDPPEVANSGEEQRDGEASKGLCGELEAGRGQLSSEEESLKGRSRSDGEAADRTVEPLADVVRARGGMRPD